MSNLDLKAIDPRLIETAARQAEKTSPRLADAIGGGANFGIIPGRGPGSKPMTKSPT